MTGDVATPGHLIEPFSERRARRADDRKASLDRERAALRATYLAAGLPVPLALIEKPPDPIPIFIPYRIKRQGRVGRPPSRARTAAIAAGRKTYVGRPCPAGHPGLRFVRQSVCVECARLRREAQKSTVRPRKAINHSARSRAQRPQMACGRVPPGPGHSVPRKLNRAPQVISMGLCAGERNE